MIIKSIFKITIIYLEAIIITFVGIIFSNKLFFKLSDKFKAKLRDREDQEFAEIEINRKVRITINDKYMDIYVKSIKCRELSKPTSKEA